MFPAPRRYVAGWASDQARKSPVEQNRDKPSLSAINE